MQHVTHRRAAFGHGIDPDGHLAGNLDHLTRLFIGDHLRAVLNPRRVLADVLDRDDRTIRQRTLQHWRDDGCGILVGTISDDADINPVADAFVASRTNRHIVQPTVDRGHEFVTFAAI